MTDNNFTTVEIGKFGEDHSCRYLWLHGWKIIERNYRYSHFEIDIIAKKGNILAFIEVKTRKTYRNSQFGTPGMAVNMKKRNNIISAAQHYLSTHDTDLQPRLDVIEVYVDTSGKKIKVNSINHIEDAYTS